MKDTTICDWQAGEFPRVLVTGVSSIHGWPLYAYLQSRLPAGSLRGVRSPRMRAASSEGVSGLCVTDVAGLGHIAREFAPTHVIHCAGVCDLDVCEERPQWAHKLNVQGTAAVLSVFGARSTIMYLSTDLVFSGNNPPPGGYCESHMPDPVSVAGRTFAQAEELVGGVAGSCIVRLGLPLGASVSGDKGALDWVGSRLSRTLPVTLFTDEFRSCVDCNAIGPAVEALLHAGAQGVYHCGGERPWSLHEIGCYVRDRGGYAPELLRGIRREQELKGPPRIGNVSLDSSRLRALLAPYGRQNLGFTQ